MVFQLEGGLLPPRSGAVPAGGRRVGLRGPPAPGAHSGPPHGGRFAQLRLRARRGRRGRLREEGGGVAATESGGADDHSGGDATQAHHPPTH